MSSDRESRERELVEIFDGWLYQHDPYLADEDGLIRIQRKRMNVKAMALSIVFTVLVLTFLSYGSSRIFVAPIHSMQEVLRGISANSEV